MQLRDRIIGLDGIMLSFDANRGGMATKCCAILADLESQNVKRDMWEFSVDCPRLQESEAFISPFSAVFGHGGKADALCFAMALFQGGSNASPAQSGLPSRRATAFRT